MADNELIIKIEATGNVSEKVDSIIKKLQELQDKGGASIKRTDIAFGALIGSLGAAAVTKGLGIIKDGFLSLASAAQDFAKESIKASIESEEAIHGLNIALQLTGNFTEEASKGLQQFASDLEKVTVFSDEAILSSIAYTETLTGLNDKALAQVTKATIDYASALGLDLQSATKIVSRAIEGNTGALQKQGISIKKGATEAEQLVNVLQGLARFNGAAEAKAKTFSGATAQLSNQFHNLQEVFGNIIVKNPAVIAALSGLAAIFAEFAKTLSENEGPGKRFVQNVLVTLLGAVEASIPAIQTLARGILETARAMAFLGAGASGVRDFLKNIAGNARGGSLGGLSETTNAFAQSVQDLGKNIDDLKGASKVFEDVKRGVAGLREDVGAVDINQAAPEVKAAKGGAKRTSSRLVDQRKKEIEDLIKLNEALFKSDAEMNEEAIAENDIRIRQRIAMAGFEAEEKEKLFAEQDVKESERDQKRIEALLAFNQTLTDINLAQNEQEILSNEAKIQTILEQENLAAAEKNKIGIALRKAEQDRDNKRLTAVSGFFGDLASLQNTNSRELFEIGKVAAIAQATIDGFLAVQKALSAFPPPFNFIAAAGVAIKTGVNVAGIASQQFKAADGLTEVPQGFPNDSFPARLTSGERVVNAEQNTDLKAFLSDGGAVAEKLDILIALQSQRQPVIVNVGGDTIVDTLQDELDSGRVLRL